MIDVITVDNTFLVLNSVLPLLCRHQSSMKHFAFLLLLIWLNEGVQGTYLFCMACLLLPQLQDRNVMFSSHLWWDE